METQVRILITHFPNGEMVPDNGNYILHLMPDKSVVGSPFGPTIITNGRLLKNGKIRFEWYQDRPDIAGYLEIDENEFWVMTGNGYSGSSYFQQIPEHKKEAVHHWIYEN